MEHKAVVDRIEDGKWAVLLIGEDQVEKVIPKASLPKRAKEGSWLRVRLEDDAVKEIILDAEATTAARGRMAAKLEQLRQRPRRLKPVTPDAQHSESPKEASVKPDTLEKEQPGPATTPTAAPITTPTTTPTAAPTAAPAPDITPNAVEDEYYDFEGCE